MIEKNKIFSTQNICLIFAILFMLVPIYIGCTFELKTETIQGVVPKATNWFNEFFKGKEDTVEKTITYSYPLRPDAMSTIFSILIYMGIVLRGDWESFKRPSYLILMVLNIIFISSFLGALISSEKIKIFFIPTSLTPQTLVVFCVVASWLCMRAIAGFSWIILFFASFGNLAETNLQLGWLGSVYILCAFLSMGMQFANGYLAINMSDLKRDFFASANTIKGDVNASIETTKNIASTVIGAPIKAEVVENVPVTSINQDTTKEIPQVENVEEVVLDDN